VPAPCDLLHFSCDAQRLCSQIYGTQHEPPSALSFLEATLSISESLGNRQITDETKFREGLGRIIDGAVDCLNASAWAQRQSVSAPK